MNNFYLYIHNINRFFNELTESVRDINLLLFSAFPKVSRYLFLKYNTVSMCVLCLIAKSKALKINNFKKF